MVSAEHGGCPGEPGTPLSSMSPKLGGLLTLGVLAAHLMGVASQGLEPVNTARNTDGGGCGDHRCSACEGDCDSEADCADGLKCFQRIAMSDTVPGCRTTGYEGTSDADSWDYCYDEALADEFRPRQCKKPQAGPA